MPHCCILLKYLGKLGFLCSLKQSLLLLTHFLCAVSLAVLRRSFRLSKRGKKTNKSMYECKKSEQYDTADVPTYEEVAPYCRAPGSKHRLVVLIGRCICLQYDSTKGNIFMLKPCLQTIYVINNWYATSFKTE